MKFKTNYGYFTDDGSEFVITNYQTPRPWINVISNGNYGLIISQLNGGFSWIGHSNFNRLTRWNQDLLLDNWGKYIYLRDDDSGEIWSPTIKPVMQPPDDYKCRHGVGYTVFSSAYKGLETSFRIFVPSHDDLEIWTIQLKNTSGKQRHIALFTYFEWCLGAATDHHREFHKTFIETEFDAQHQILYARKRLWEIPTSRGHWNANWDYVAYFAASEPVNHFEGDKERFVGLYGDLRQPQAVVAGNLSDHCGRWNDSIASLQKRFDLHPGATQTIHFYLGAEKQVENAYALIEKYRSEREIQSAFSGMQHHWRQILNATTIETPDDAMNFLTNTWLKYQAISGRIWGRAAYYQQSGAYGFRDQLQDSQVFLYSQPELTKKQIFLHARHQFKEGNVLHWWHPLIEQGMDTRMSDDLLWLPFMVIQYLKETADWKFLNELMPYYNDQQPASILQHCLQAIDWSLARFSERGLPLILAGDWNDGLSAVGLEGKGESVWLGHFLFYLLNEFALILNHHNEAKKAALYKQRADRLQDAINTHCWDGDWFWRASKDNGELIGSHQNKEGKIFLNAQIWAIIAASTSAGRMQKVIESVEQHLEKKNGTLLLHPAYQQPDFYIGYLSRYAPGVRENGGVYTHAATWAIYAECLLKRADAAYRLYQKLCPIMNSLKPDEYVVEPYVTPGNIDGPDSPYYGRGGWTWYTGSAAWLLRITIDYLLGIRAEYNGLIIDPCLPAHWDHIKINRLFRGCTYFISIEKSTTKEIRVDGEVISGNCIPPVAKNSAQVVVQI